VRCHKNRIISLIVTSPKEAKEGTVTVNTMDPVVKSPLPIKMPTRAMMTELAQRFLCEICVRSPKKAQAVTLSVAVTDFLQQQFVYVNATLPTT
jgi:hypothetical protein